MIPDRMERLEIENMTEDELRRRIEQSAKQAVETGLREMRDTIERFTKTAYLHKTWRPLKRRQGTPVSPRQRSVGGVMEASHKPR